MVLSTIYPQWGGDLFVNRRSKPFDPYNGKDPREIPAYSAAQAAHYLWVPEGTLRTWTRGREYPSGKGYSAPVVCPADPAGGILSFVNLLELHVLSAIRRHHGVDMRRVRRAVGYLAERYGHKHPLIDEKMETDGSHLFIQKLGQLEDISENGQLAMRAVLEVHLKRIEWDANGIAVRMYPFSRSAGDLSAAPKSIAIDPRVAFGRPVIAGSRVPTIEIAERFTAGDSHATLVREYGLRPQDIDEAIRCELRKKAA